MSIDPDVCEPVTEDENAQFEREPAERAKERDRQIDAAVREAAERRRQFRERVATLVGRNVPGAEAYVHRAAAAAEREVSGRRRSSWEEAAVAGYFLRENFQRPEPLQRLCLAVALGDPTAPSGGFTAEDVEQTGAEFAFHPVRDFYENIDLLDEYQEDSGFPVPDVTRADFFADLPNGNYIFRPTRDSWPAKSVNATLGRIGRSMAAAWLDRHAPIHCKTWHPGCDEVVVDRVVSGGGWSPQRGLRTFNLYLPPVLEHGDPTQAGPWREHLRKLYPDDAEHIERFFGHRVQMPGVKINHGLVLLGDQGIGKDTLIEPLKQAVGPWNFHEVAPPMLLGSFNSFIKSVVLRVSEARDMGDVNRYALYEHMKTLLAAPPDTLRCNEKHTKEYSVFNVSGVIITTNHRARGIYLPSDDRRHYVAGTTLTKDDFEPGYWPRLWRWYYEEGGLGHVAAFLAELDLSEFDEKAPPPKTRWWHAIVEESRTSNDDLFAEVLEALGRPQVLTVTMLRNRAQGDLAEWLEDKRNIKAIGPALVDAGYMAVKNPHAKDGKWRGPNGKKQSVYALAAVSDGAQVEAARALMADPPSENF